MSSDDIVCDFERHSNHVVHHFKMCDSQTLCRIFSSHCESFYDCELLNYNMLLYVQFVCFMAQCYRHIFKLPQRTHNFIVSNIANCVTIRLDRRLCKLVYNVLHNYNLVVK